MKKSVSVAHYHQIGTIRRYVEILALIAIATAIAVIVSSFAPLDSVSAIYMLPVLIAAVRHGTGPSVLAAFAGALMTSLFYPPLFSVLVFSPAQLIDLATSLVVALTVGRLAGRLREEMMLARGKEREIREVYALSRAIAAAGDVAAVLATIADHMTQALARPVALMLQQGEEPMRSVRSGFGPETTQALADAAQGFLRQGGDMVGIVHLPRHGRWLLCRLPAGADMSAVLAVPLPDPGEADGRSVEILAQAMLEEAARSLERLGVAQVLEERRLRERSDALRDILVESVSHELRTPLAGIIGAASVLAGVPDIADRPALHDLATSIETEARRLDRLIQNVLDLGRIRAGALQAKREDTDPVDVVNEAIDRAAARLGDHAVLRAYAEPLPLLRIDPVLIAQALVNIIENAAKYAPADTPIRIALAVEAGTLAIEVSDEGPGLEAREAEQIFARFHRGERHADIAGGSGLGLTVAKTFVEANGGRIMAISEGAGRGTTMRILLPAQPLADAAGRAL